MPDAIDDGEYMYYFDSMECVKVNDIFCNRLKFKTVKFSTGMGLLLRENPYTKQYDSAPDFVYRAFIKWEKEEVDRILLQQKD